MLYILSKETLEIKETIQTINYEINLNIDVNGKSFFVVPNIPKAVNGDYVKYGDYHGIITNVETEKDKTTTTIHADEMEGLFDRKCILTQEVIARTSVEQFIDAQILEHFVWSDDWYINIPYLVHVALSDTPDYATIRAEDGIYNLRTYIGNMLEKHDIKLEFSFENNYEGERRLFVLIKKRDLPTLDVDANIEDIITFEENYAVDTIAKVTVLSKESGNKFDYFLLTDRTTTTDRNNSNRASGKIEMVACETDEDAESTALDEFRRNRYNHNIELTLFKDSKIYREKDFVVGRKLRIKTKENKIYDTFISKINKKFNSNIYTVTCGNMPVTLLDKLKGVV